MSTNFDERVNKLANKYYISHLTKNMSSDELYSFVCKYFLGQDRVDVSHWSDVRFEQELIETLGYSATFLQDEDKFEVFSLLREKAQELKERE